MPSVHQKKYSARAQTREYPQHSSESEDSSSDVFESADADPDVSSGFGVSFAVSDGDESDVSVS